VGKSHSWAKKGEKKYGGRKKSGTFKRKRVPGNGSGEKKKSPNGGNTGNVTFPRPRGGEKSISEW